MLFGKTRFKDRFHIFGKTLFQRYKDEMTKEFQNYERIIIEPISIVKRKKKYQIIICFMKLKKKKTRNIFVISIIYFLNLLLFICLIP